tara:strand:+ start:301 stop:531 length:231 start_codon:yes stop_codon:yes gene_type:complete
MTFSNPRPEEEIADDITLSTETTGTVDFNIDPAGYVNYHDHGEILAKLDDLSAKLDHLLEHAHQGYEVTLKKNESS